MTSVIEAIKFEGMKFNKGNEEKDQYTECVAIIPTYCVQLCKMTEEVTPSYLHSALT